MPAAQPAGRSPGGGQGAAPKARQPKARRPRCGCSTTNPRWRTRPLAPPHGRRRTRRHSARRRPAKSKPSRQTTIRTVPDPAARPAMRRHSRSTSFRAIAPIGPTAMPRGRQAPRPTKFPSRSVNLSSAWHDQLPRGPWMASTTGADRGSNMFIYKALSAIAAAAFGAAIVLALPGFSPEVEARHASPGGQERPPRHPARRADLHRASLALLRRQLPAQRPAQQPAPHRARRHHGPGRPLTAPTPSFPDNGRAPARPFAFGASLHPARAPPARAIVAPGRNAGVEMIRRNVAPLIVWMAMIAVALGLADRLSAQTPPSERDLQGLCRPACRRCQRRRRRDRASDRRRRAGEHPGFRTAARRCTSRSTASTMRRRARCSAWAPIPMRSMPSAMTS